MSNDTISSFDDLSSKLDMYIQKDYSDWITLRTVQHICIYPLDIVHVPRISASIRIDQSLRVDAFKDELKLDSSALQGALGPNCVLKCWSQLSTILSQIRGLISPGGELFYFDSTVNCVEMLLEELSRKVGDSHDNSADIRCAIYVS
jgi:hypothetical protein